MVNQRHLFSLPESVHYLNCATMALFDTIEEVKSKFSQLINCPDAQRIAVMPSVSYGMATVVKTLLKKRWPETKKKVVVVGAEFPSDVYAWEELVEQSDVFIQTVEALPTTENKCKQWNEALISAIDSETLLICISPTHWTDGTQFHLKAIKETCIKHEVLLIIDGTQHVGACPFDVREIEPDFMIVAAYKWLLGPYSSALAYCGEYFDDGVALEQTWSARKNSNEFKNLVNYQNELRPKAFKYNVGEFSNFINLPMIAAGLDHLLEWTPANIESYASSLGQQLIEPLRAAEYWIEDEAFRGKHMFGIQAPPRVNVNDLKKELLKNQVYVSYRGSAIRLSINVWNTSHDIEVFKDILLRVAAG